MDFRNQQAQAGNPLFGGNHLFLPQYGVPGVPVGKGPLGPHVWDTARAPTQCTPPPPPRSIPLYARASLSALSRK